MFKGMFGSEDKKKSEEDQKQKAQMQDEMKKLIIENLNLKQELKLAWDLINQKQTYIQKLKKIVIEHLNKPEYEENFNNMEASLQEMFRKESYYNPEELVHSPFATSPQELKIPSSEEQKAEKNENKEEDIAKEIKKKIEKEPENNIDEDKVNFTMKAVSIGDSPITKPIQGRVKRSTSLSKVKEDRRYLIKPKDSQTLLRELLDFELELKTYCPQAYTELVEFSKKASFTPDEIFEEIEILGENLEKIKFFQMIWPKDTRDKLMDSLENYIFEVIVNKVMKPDDDALAMAQQLKDRMIILRNMITFEMLDIPLSMRDPNIYRFSIKELEKIPVFSSPLLKVEAFQNCTNHLINLYLEREKRNPDADELFPLMMYAVLHAEIDKLKIHVDFIGDYMRRTFALGQLGYLVINLKAVIQFLQDVDGKSLAEGRLAVKRPDQYQSFESEA